MWQGSLLSVLIKFWSRGLEGMAMGLGEELTDVKKMAVDILQNVIVRAGEKID